MELCSCNREEKRQYVRDRETRSNIVISLEDKRSMLNLILTFIYLFK